jgi:hypothetical protein
MGSLPIPETRFLRAFPATGVSAGLRTFEHAADDVAHIIGNRAIAIGIGERCDEIEPLS